MIEQQPQTNFDIFKKLIPHLWPRNNVFVKVRVSLSLICLIIAKVATVGTPLFMIWAVDSLSGDLNTNNPKLLLGVGSVGLVISYGVMRVFSVGFNELRDGIFAMVGQRALRHLALQTFSHIHALSLRFHIERKTGALNRIIDRGVKGVDFLLRFLLFSILPLILELFLVGVLLIVRYDWTYAAFVFLTIVLYVWYTFKVTDWRVSIRKRMNARDNEANQKSIDSLLNYETVKFFNAESRERTRYDMSMKEYEKAAIQTGVSLALLNFGQAFLITGGLVSVMLLAALGVMEGTLTIGEFVGINAIMVQLLMPLNFLGFVYREIRQALVDMGEMFRVLDQPVEISDKKNSPYINFSKGHIEFNTVSFDYDGDRSILKEVSFEVPPGKTLAIVGPSGSGKSTIARLLFRFYDVKGGSICIDGQDLRDVSQLSLRQKIGVVPQDTVLFNDTIGYNIAYGKVDASTGDIERAAKAAQIYDFVMSLPQGFDTLVGERGLKLSGGEKQRVGIARTFLKNPSVLLLDEATSALDSETEKEILNSLKLIGKGRSVITIAHRLSTVSNADNIIVLEKGEIVETGSHQELLKLRRRYFDMWKQQQDEESDYA
jgi:ATP-binding cassette subfamily B protein